MVARKEGAEPPARALVARGFQAWRRWLTSVLNLPARVYRSAGAQTQRPPTADTRMLIGGVTCLVAGALARMLMADPGPSTALATIAALTSVVLAIGRYALLALTLRRRTTPLADIRFAWSCGLIPWIAAVGPVLAAVAWAASGVVTYRVLRGRLVTAPDAWRAVGWAWGAHAAIVIIAWFARNAWVALLLAE
ncbi:MAG: hypothetical protein U1E26_10060 [Coriobacteriia bacterium]|nr:hypothetical protein [Coriobacteriia bacterium]